MESDHLQAIEREHRYQCREDRVQAQYVYDMAVEKARNVKYTLPKITKLPWWAPTLLLLVVGPLALIVIGIWVFHSSKQWRADAAVKKAKEALDKAIAVEDYVVSELMRIETNSYNNQVDQAREHYLKSQDVGEIVQWLLKEMIRVRQKASRESFRAYVETSVYILVDSTHIQTAMGERYIFQEHNFRDITEFHDRVGLAQALRDLLKAEMEAWLVNNGQDLSTVQWKAGGNDNSTTLCLLEPNPDYQHPRTL